MISNRNIDAATIAVINLDRCVSEREAFYRRNAHLGQVRHFSAVAGTDVDRTALGACGIIAGGLEYSSGALGCALSHLALWQTVVGGIKALTICEDDAVFAENFIAVANARLAALPAAWDIVLWGWNFDSSLVFHVLPGKPAFLVQGDGAVNAAHLAAAMHAPATAQLFRLDRACGTLCYTVSPAGAARLLAHCVPLRDLALSVPEAGVTWPNRGIDMMMSTIYPRLQAYVRPHVRFAVEVARRTCVG